MLFRWQVWWSEISGISLFQLCFREGLHHSRLSSFHLWGRTYWCKLGSIKDKGCTAEETKYSKAWITCSHDLWLAKAVQSALPQKLEPVRWVNSTTGNNTSWTGCKKLENMQLQSHGNYVQETGILPIIFHKEWQQVNKSSGKDGGRTLNFYVNLKENSPKTKTCAQIMEMYWRKSSGIPQLPCMLWSQLPKYSLLVYTKS